MFTTLKSYLEKNNISKETFEGYEAEKKAGIFNEINEANETAFKELSAKEDENSKAISKMRDELLDVQKEQYETLKKALKEQGLELQKVKKGEGMQEFASKTFDQVLGDALKNREEDLKAIKFNNSKDSVVMTVKAPAPILRSTNISGGNVPVEDRLEGFNTIASRRVRFLDVLSKRTTTSNVVSWVYQANKDGSAGQTAEGSVKNNIDFDIVVDNETVKKTTAYIKVSTEMLDDISWIQSEINAELLRELLKAVEVQAYEGDGTGQNLNGVRTVATAFNAGTFAGTIDNANDVDVLTVAMDQIMIAEQDEANYIFMHPSDVTALKMVKVSATDKRYVERLALIAGQLSLDGVQIIPTTLVTQGEYLIGNFEKSLLVTREDVMIDIGLDADDFTKNLRTILAEWRGLTLVKQNDRTAFVAGVFATDKALLETA